MAERTNNTQARIFKFATNTIHEHTLDVEKDASDDSGSSAGSSRCATHRMVG